MKINLFIKILTLLFLFTSHVAKSEISFKTPKFEINLPENSNEKERSLNYKDLQKKVKYLESAVRELQDEVYHLSRRNSSTRTVIVQRDSEKRAPSLWSCTLTTSFDVYSADGKNKEQARGKVLKKCGGGIFCKEEKIKCSN